jgi:hypothetical protein
MPPAEGAPVAINQRPGSGTGEVGYSDRSDLSAVSRRCGS